MRGLKRCWNRNSKQRNLGEEAMSPPLGVNRSCADSNALPFTRFLFQEPRAPLISDSGLLKKLMKKAKKTK